MIRSTIIIILVLIFLWLVFSQTVHLVVVV